MKILLFFIGLLASSVSYSGVLLHLQNDEYDPHTDILLEQNKTLDALVAQYRNSIMPGDEISSCKGPAWFAAAFGSMGSSSRKKAVAAVCGYSSKSAAEQGAIASCQKRGGVSCRVKYALYDNNTVSFTHGATPVWRNGMLVWDTISADGAYQGTYACCHAEYSGSKVGNNASKPYVSSRPPPQKPKEPSQRELQKKYAACSADVYRRVDACTATCSVERPSCWDQCSLTYMPLAKKCDSYVR